MDTAKYADTLADMTDEPSQCELCRGPLADDEPWVCSACAEDKMTWYDIDPSDIELARRDAMIERGYLNLAALIAGVSIA